MKKRKKRREVGRGPEEAIRPRNHSLEGACDSAPFRKIPERYGTL